MILLALETTAATASVALFADGALLIERATDGTRRHAESLLPLVEAALLDAGLPLLAVDRIAVDVGPGSFTGVRIGVTAANALGFALGKPVVPVDALRALAEELLGEPRPIAALIDAGNGNGYAALYQNGVCRMEPAAVETAAWLAKLPLDAVFVGDGAADATHRIPAARNVGRAALSLPDAAEGRATPLYLRPSQAERVRAAREEGTSR